MNNFKKRFLDYVIGDRRTPEKNRERVGQNLMILSVFVFFVFIINFIIIIGTDRKFGVNLSKGASSVYQTVQKVQAKRGTIYDRNGNPIAEDSTTYNVYAVIDKSYVSTSGEKLYVQPSQYNKVADILHQHLGMDKKYVISQLGQKKLTQVSFGTKGSDITYSTMTAVTKAFKDAKIKGVAFTTSPGRMYPNGTFASQFIGLAQVKENKDGSKSLVGATGMEAALDKLLSGKDGQVTYEKDKNGNTLLGAATTVKKAVDGKDVYTTLSAPIQTYLETQMDTFQSKAQGVQASATLVNAKTGEILATSQRPSFNSDTKEGLDAKGFTWQNTLYQTNYEPGSTMKVMLLAAAIDEGVFNPNETYNNASLSLADATIKDWSVNEGISQGGYMTFAQGFAYSSNVGMTLLEQKMGNDKWLSYLSKYRFGLPTRFGMGSEASGLLPSDNAVTIAMSAFGQGIGVTQTQMLRAFSSVSNDGVMLEPQFITKIYDPKTGTSRTAKKEVVGNPVSADAAKQTRQYMVTVGTDPSYGTLYSASLGGPVIKVGNQSVAVKSGTAQIASEDGSGYLTGSTDYIYSVVAMVPSDNPDFIMYVTLQQPKTFSFTFWQDVVNPVLEEATLMKDTLLSPVETPEDQQTKYRLPDVIGKSPGNTADELRQNLVHPIVLGTGNKITKTSVAAGSNLKENQQVLMLTSHFETMPDMYGWTKKNVKKFEDWTGINVVFKGKKSGKVIKQSISTGSKLKNLKKIKITLGD
ncbi:penicillin-binding protein PBP2X [Streptococcus ratti]|uniref:Penicillin-binding protein 2X n=1 Tax=Streptococcus ratti FA-1 = DSM 20564 TaxID=699248 RepID=A0ABP2R1F5_STRRT|nr:penicillin-binding protein PBP2X [Streptococcus ratti]EJN95145.1 penicillin-binding protein 2X [Streptococcus ratti FA-1 = DSM 20564]EMP71618.1 penicillin-binding protein 2X [Streptococcus ratti FA-1 = DSM 20564]VEI59565.1 penicillin-binding protein 2X [Streptococcus mutans]